jgi:hypothetical protein
MRLLPVLLIALCATGCRPTDAQPTQPTAPVEAATTEAVEGTNGATPAADQMPPAEEAPQDTLVDGVYTSHYFNLRFRLPPGFDLVDTAQEGRTARPPRDGQALPNPPAYFLEADGMRFPVQLGGDGPLGLPRSYDSLTFVGPPDSGIYMVVANSNSAQLGTATFEGLDERVSFTAVRFDAENAAARTVGGVPAYFGEGDAQVQGEAVAVAFMALGIATVGTPTSVTLFVPFDVYATCYEQTTAADGSGAQQACGPLGYKSDVMRAVLDSIEIVDIRRSRTR